MSCICTPQVTVLRSYDTMIATARRQAEGSLIYILDKADLYLRVRDGIRQVMVPSSSSQPATYSVVGGEQGQTYLRPMKSEAKGFSTITS